METEKTSGNTAAARDEEAAIKEHLTMRLVDAPKGELQRWAESPEAGLAFYKVYWHERVAIRPVDLFSVDTVSG